MLITTGRNLEVTSFLGCDSSPCVLDKTTHKIKRAKPADRTDISAVQPAHVILTPNFAPRILYSIPFLDGRGRD